MSKAEDLSKQYKDFREQCGIKDPIMLDEIEEAYFEGYHQAEKDLELSWINVKDIYDICCDVFNDYDGDFYDMPKLWKEVLKRFKERKEK